MTGFVKLFSSILDSTVWTCENKETKLVWITLLAMKNRLQVVNSSVPGLAKRAGVSLEECEFAIKRLSSPDPYSKSKEDEGRRIRQVEGGFFVINGASYRNSLTTDDMREYKRVKQAEYRARKRGHPLPGEALAVKTGEGPFEYGREDVQ